MNFRSAALQSSSLHVVIVEDDVELRDAILAPALRADGCQVVGAGNAAELYRAMLERVPDVVVLDIRLPDQSGFEVARYLRESSDVGIVMLTGRVTTADRVRGLDLGADAYLTKPVDAAVVCATVRSVARRLAPADRNGGAWALGADGWRLIAPNGVTVDLSATERMLLQLLFAEANTTVQRETLIAALADDANAFDPHRLDMVMHRLRRKLAEAGMPALPLHTVRGVGYVLVPRG
ncbi:response regulator transcription factor [Tahibacter caeni]|uniref:response regulator transcription factor n=1 Tax=Tahibacter caeni TaxID=1453545 RepID=UPI002147E0BC|nr:response regulator transcription factor [Tahibacter caeni]